MSLPIAWASGSLPPVVGSAVALGSGGVGTLDSDTIEFTQAAGQAAHVRWDLGQDETEVAFRAYFQTPAAWPGASFNVVALNTAAHGSVAMLAFSGSGAPGQLRLLTTGGGTVVSSPSNTVAVNTWYRVELQLDTPGSRARAAVFPADSDTALWASPWQVNANYAVAVQRIVVGAVNASPTVGKFAADEILATDLPAVEGWLGAPPIPTDPIGLQQRLDDFAVAVGRDVGRLQKSTFGRPLAAFEAALSRAWTQPCRILWMGSSTTVGSASTNPGLDFVTRVTRRLQSAHPSIIAGYEAPVVPLGTGYPTVNARPGVQSYKSAAGGGTSESYFNTTVQPFTVWQRPQLVVHSVGLNDSLLVEPYAVPPNEYEANVSAAIDYLDANSLRPVSHIVVHSYRRSETSVSRWRQYRQALLNIARSRPNVLFIDIEEEFQLLDPFGADLYDLIDADGLHPSDNGHAFIADIILKKMGLLSLPNDSGREQVLDTFTRPNVTTVTGAIPEKPANVAWSSPAGAVGAISGKTLRITTSGTLFLESGLSDLELDAMISLPAQVSTLPGLVFRGSDDNNRMGIFLNPVTSQVQLYRTMAGATAVVQQPTLALPGGDYVLQVRAEGNRVWGYVNGTKYIDYTLTTDEMTALGALTKVGFRNGSTNAGVGYHFIRASRL